MKTAGSLHRVIASVLLALSVLVILLALLDVSGSFRLLVVTAFSLLAPGWAVVAFWRPDNKATEWITAVAVSISILIIVAMAMVLLSAWYPVPVFVTLAAVTAAALVIQLRRTDLTEVAAR